MDSSLPLRLSGAVAAALALSGVGVQSASAQQAAQTPSPLMQALVGPLRPNTARQYATPDGAVRFVLDRSGGRVALVRFEGDPEVHVLRPYGGSGGDELYRTESGDVLLRVTPHGGITVYTRSNQGGAAVLEEQAVAPLTPQPAANPQSHLREVQLAAARRLGRPVAFETNAPAGVGGGVIVDAAERAAEGIVRERNPNIRRVFIVLGPRPAAAVRGDTLIVQVAPDMGYAGRPSSAAIRTIVQRAAEQGPER